MTDNERMRQLIDEINNASEAYYGGKAELMSNYEWDAKLDELEMLETKTGIVLPDSPTHNVSHEEVKGNKVRHEFPALSLQKSKNVTDLLKWADNKPVNLSWKLDGLTLVVTYNNGKLTRVVTRGDGVMGSDITHLAPSISNILPEIEYKGHIVIRGEAVISYDDFEAINKKYNNAYENPRNLAAGSCNPLTTADLIADRQLVWLPFTLVDFEQDNYRWSERMEYLRSLGFRTVDFELISNPEHIVDKISEWSNNVENFEYPVDGLVLTYNDVIYASGGNITGHHDTRGGFAFKWADEEAETVLTDIEWSVSINSINPVAIFEEVRLEGTTVSRASLCNVSVCKHLGIGSAGTKLTVIKSNKIIPKVVKAEQCGILTIPDVCPVCKHATEIVVSDKGVETLICTNKTCAAKNISKMSRFVSKYGFDIMGLSEKKLESLINKNLISNCLDILKLPDNEADVYAILSDADGWGKKSIDNMLNAILNARTVSAEKFLYALCIPTCGRQVAKDLMLRHSVEDLFSLTAPDISAIIGDVKSDNFTAWFSDDENRNFVSALLQICRVKNLKKTAASTGILSDKIFVITGSLNNFSSRDVLKEYIENNGGKVAGSVSSKTTYLINNDIESNSSKNKKAKELGVAIITEAEFIDMIQET